MRLLLRIAPVLFLAVSFAQTDPPEKTARTILETKCAACHGAARMSDLDLRDRDTILKGGKRGPAIVPGKADESLLYKAVRREGELQMPPGKTALTAAEVNAIRDWINGGRKVDVHVPGTRRRRRGGRSRSPCGRRARGEGCVAGPQSDRRLHPCEARAERPATRARSRSRGPWRAAPISTCTDCRRRPSRWSEFVNDKSPDAYEKLIDRLLASPRYGERWGRYWLDLVRYADTSGFETDHFFITAWRYRDWVIESFNADKPYTTFVQEQIAADESVAHQHGLRGLTASCPRRRRRTSSAASAPGCSRSARSRSSTRITASSSARSGQADAVDTVGAAFLGLTVGCARCHDHKFDPISQRDYYRMTALFAGSASARSRW